MNTEGIILLPVDHDPQETVQIGRNAESWLSDTKTNETRTIEATNEKGETRKIKYTSALMCDQPERPIYRGKPIPHDECPNAYIGWSGDTPLPSPSLLERGIFALFRLVGQGRRALARQHIPSFINGYILGGFTVIGVILYKRLKGEI